MPWEIKNLQHKSASDFTTRFSRDESPLVLLPFPGLDANGFFIFQKSKGYKTNVNLIVGKSIEKLLRFGNNIVLGIFNQLYFGRFLLLLSRLLAPKFGRFSLRPFFGAFIFYGAC